MSGSTPTPTAAPTPPAATTWGAMTVTLLIFAAYFAWVAIAYLLKLDSLYSSLSELPKQGVMIALGYWLGSSKGSADKSAALPSAAPIVVAAPTVPTPVAPIPAPAPTVAPAP
jgi:hypothetical protein